MLDSWLSSWAGSKSCDYVMWVISHVTTLCQLLINSKVGLWYWPCHETTKLYKLYPRDYLVVNNFFLQNVLFLISIWNCCFNLETIFATLFFSVIISITLLKWCVCMCFCVLEVNIHFKRDLHKFFKILLYAFHSIKTWSLLIWLFHYCLAFFRGYQSA